ncbi:MAG TPA: hypothetical protein VF287_01915 [Usitatibacter sp.]
MAIARNGMHSTRQIPVVLEADEAAIEEMVGIGREEQAILSIEALLVARVPPRLALERGVLITFALNVPCPRRVNYLRYDPLP